MHTIVDIYLQVNKNHPSFSTAKVLCSHTQMLPEVPQWYHREITVPGHWMKDPMVLYWHDGLKVIKHLFANPMFSNCMELDPYKLMDLHAVNPIKSHVYGEFMSGEYAECYVVCIFISHFCTTANMISLSF